MQYRRCLNICHPYSGGEDAGLSPGACPRREARTNPFGSQPERCFLRKENGSVAPEPALTQRTHACRRALGQLEFDEGARRLGEGQVELHQLVTAEGVDA